MSGGSLNYFYCLLGEHVGDFGDKELDDLVQDLTELFEAREWYLSGDTGEGSWREARDNFKKKWFTECGRKERIEKYLKQIASELFDSFGFGHYCEECVEWTPKEGSDYGKCNLDIKRLYHKCDHCDSFGQKADAVERNRGGRSMDELISRQDVIDAVYNHSDSCGYWVGTAKDMEELLNGLPTADPERKKGKWIWLSSTYDRTPCEMRFWCSECHHETIVHTSGTSDPWEHYCPNCGADMRGDE